MHSTISVRMNGLASKGKLADPPASVPDFSLGDGRREVKTIGTSFNLAFV